MEEVIIHAYGSRIYKYKIYGKIYGDHPCSPSAQDPTLQLATVSGFPVSFHGVLTYIQASMKKKKKRFPPPFKKTQVVVYFT